MCPAAPTNSGRAENSDAALNGGACGHDPRCVNLTSGAFTAPDPLTVTFTGSVGATRRPGCGCARP